MSAWTKEEAVTALKAAEKAAFERVLADPITLIAVAILKPADLKLLKLFIGAIHEEAFRAGALAVSDLAMSRAEAKAAIAKASAGVSQ